MASKYLDYSGLTHFKDKLDDIINEKQEKLVSGSNIKTIANISLLGGGNISPWMGIDGSNLISYTTWSSSKPFNFTASEDCIAIFDNNIGTNFKTYVYVDGNDLHAPYPNNQYQWQIPLLSGQTLQLSAAGGSNTNTVSVYGIKK